MAWSIEYDNDTGASDDGFYEWWMVTNGVFDYKCDNLEAAEYLQKVLNAQDEKPFAWAFRYCTKKGDFQTQWTLTCDARDAEALSKFDRPEDSTYTEVIEVFRAPREKSVWKDHNTRELVNELTTVAKDYGHTQQLRARISSVVIDAIDRIFK
jgi:hypothetical protein